MGLHGSRDLWQVLACVPRHSRHEPPLVLSTYQHGVELRPIPGAQDAHRSEHSGMFGQMGQSE
jgi:hypothetical protein